MSVERVLVSQVRYEVFDQVAEDLRTAYCTDNRPWVVGFSGGKDSTALLQMVYNMVRGLTPEQRTKHIYVLASDTRVEPPRYLPASSANCDR